MTTWFRNVLDCQVHYDEPQAFIAISHMTCTQKKMMHVSYHKQTFMQPTTQLLSQSKMLQPTYYKWKQTSLSQDKEFLEN